LLERTTLSSFINNSWRSFWSRNSKKL